jgi:DNA-binding Xre family transcriptional regulator
MVIKTKIRELAESRGVKTAYELHTLTGLAINATYRLWGDEFTRLDLETINKLCNALRCKPADLFEYRRDKS